MLPFTPKSSKSKPRPHNQEESISTPQTAKKRGRVEDHTPSPSSTQNTKKLNQEEDSDNSFLSERERVLVRPNIRLQLWHSMRIKC